ncbi:nucleolar protein 11 [Canis lupus familiaris]|uniref:nucleolar protein 11 n=1 Tax=Canis lupus familiaris TaxID=9615 RepID=UPI00005A1B0A|nr:nucleolar protein 11 [Canis lupus familiaris]XP_853495.1 nucleolar protein 11 [Canis lupus familiaris]|eukprot:XP_853495.1 nucleolar protein 11 isoform X1 [Canis lupus familiaris]
MAALEEGFTLSAVPLGAGPHGLLGVEQSDRPDQFLVTDGGRTVILYKVSDQKPLGSWSVKQGQVITCPAVCNFQTGEYIVVHDNKVLRIWSNEDVNLDKVFKATLSAEVYRIHSIQGTEPLVLFKEGAVRGLEALLAEPQQKIETVISDEEVIKWTKFFMVFRHPVLIFITEKHRNYFAYVQMFNSCTLSKYTLLLGHEEKSVIQRFTASVDRKVISLMSLSSDGCIYKSLIPIHPNDPEKNQRVVRSLLLKTVVSGNVRNGIALTVLDQDHIAVLGPPLPASKECVSIWNTKFQTLQTSKELPQGTSGQLWYYGENLFMLHGKFLTVIPYKCEVSSLAGALGKLKHSQDPGTQTVPHFVNWETSRGYGFGSQNSEQSKRILRRRKIEVSVQPPPSKQLLSTIKKDSEKRIVEELCKFLASKQTPDFHTIIGDIVLELLGRHKVEPSFYPRNALMQLIRTHVLSYSLCPGLMEVALEKTDVQMLQLCLQQFPDIPESVTCACLKIFLSISDDSLQEAEINMESVSDYIDSVQEEKMEEQTEILHNGFNPEEENCDNCDRELNKKPQDTAEETTSCPVIPKRAALLNAILHSAYSEMFLLPHLKDIPAQHVTLFLQYLYFLYLKCSENATMTLPGLHPPTLNQIMDWICLLLDANFTVVVMIPEAKRLLLSLYKFVKSQICICSELNKIEVSFRELQKLNQEKNNRELYSIEVLELF